jgi:hypothetical protein
LSNPVDESIVAAYSNRVTASTERAATMATAAAAARVRKTSSSRRVNTSLPRLSVTLMTPSASDPASMGTAAKDNVRYLVGLELKAGKRLTSRTTTAAATSRHARSPTRPERSAPL